MIKSMHEVQADDGQVVGRLVVDVEELARHIALRMDPDALMDAEDVGAYLKFTPRYVTERLVGSPSFPAAIRLAGPNGSRSNPRWRRRDIVAYVDSHIAGMTKRGGRPRNDPWR